MQKSPENESPIESQRGPVSAGDQSEQCEAPQALSKEERTSFLEFHMPYNITFIAEDPKVAGVPIEFSEPPQPAVASIIGREVNTDRFMKYMEQVCKFYFMWLADRPDGDPFEGLFMANSEHYAETVSESISKVKKAVPAVFLDEDYDLDDPRVFDLVAPRDLKWEAIDSKLYEHLDVVETQLMRHVAARSDAFWGAIQTFQNMHRSIGQVLIQIAAMRSYFRKLDHRLVVPPLHVAYLQRRRDHLRTVYEKLKLMSAVQHIQETVQRMLSTSNYIGALEFIDHTQQLLRRELGGIRCMRYLALELADQVDVVGSMMQAEFVNLTVEGTGRQHVHRYRVMHPIPPMSPLGKPRHSGATKPIWDELDKRRAEFRERMVPLIERLFEMGLLTDALIAFQAVIGSEINRSFKKAFISSDPRLAALFPATNELTEEDPMSSVPLTHCIQTMDHEAFISALSHILGFQYALLERSTITRDLVLIKVQSLFKIAPRSSGLTAEGATSSRSTSPTTLPHSPRSPISNIDIGSLFSDNAHRAVHAPMMPVNGPGQDRESEGSLGDSISEPGSAVTPRSNTFNNGSRAPTPQQQQGAMSPMAFLQLGHIGGGQGQGVALVQRLIESVELAFESAYSKMNQILLLRSEVNARLSFRDFSQFYDLVRNFVLASEELSTKRSFHLRDTLGGQADGFLTTFHSSKLATFQALLDSEPWVQAEIPPDFQEMLDHLTANDTTGVFIAPPVAPAVSSPHQSFKSPPSSGTRSNPMSPTFSSPPETNAKPLSATSQFLDRTLNRNASLSHIALSHIEFDKAKKLTVGGQAFCVVNAVLLLLQMLVDYVNCQSLIPALAVDIVPKIIELLQIFNTRSRELIMGGQAVQMAGLKNVSIPHLGLLSQCLTLVMMLIPFLSVSCRPNIPARSTPMMAEFERLMTEYVQHRNEIFNSFITGIHERMDFHMKALQNWRWDGESASLPSAPILIKEITTLHKMLSPMLPQDQLLIVFTRIVSALAERLIDYFTRLKVSTPKGKIRVTEDIMYIVNSLRAINISVDALCTLEKLTRTRFAV